MKDLRVNYVKGQLLESDVPENPLELFATWFDEALADSNIHEANALILSTSVQGKVDSRTILLKDLRDGEFVFYTNYNSNKAKQLGENPHCSLVFPWFAMERQILIRGTASRVSEVESSAYFLSRPRASQIGAWASRQSEIIGSREDLEKNLQEATDKFAKEPLTKPPNWGGFAVLPVQIEFWQGRPNRLHDRLVYGRNEGSNSWEIQRLQP